MHRRRSAPPRALPELRRSTLCGSAGCAISSARMSTRSRMCGLSLRSSSKSAIALAYFCSARSPSLRVSSPRCRAKRSSRRWGARISTTKYSEAAARVEAFAARRAEGEPLSRIEGARVLGPGGAAERRRRSGPFHDALYRPMDRHGRRVGAANWTVTDPSEPANSVPGADDVVSIDNNGSSGCTIAYNSTSTITAVKSGTVVTLDLQSGSLIDRFGGTVDFELDVEASATLAVGAGYKLSTRARPRERWRAAAQSTCLATTTRLTPTTSL